MTAVLQRNPRCSSNYWYLTCLTTVQYLGMPKQNRHRKSHQVNRNEIVFESFFIRLILTRSDSELLVFIFSSEKRIGLLMLSDFSKSDGIKSDLRIR